MMMNTLYLIVITAIVAVMIFFAIQLRRINNGYEPKNIVHKEHYMKTKKARKEPFQPNSWVLSCIKRLIQDNTQIEPDAEIWFDDITYHCTDDGFEFYTTSLYFEDVVYRVPYWYPVIVRCSRNQYKKLILKNINNLDDFEIIYFKGTIKKNASIYIRYII